MLLEAVPDSVALRASIVIGARSRSFRFLVRLVERMPVMVIPAWGGTARRRSMSATCCAAHRGRRCAAVGGRSLDLAGPDVVSYQELIERIRDHLLLAGRRSGCRGLTLTPIASRVSAVIAGEEHALIGPLMAGLETDLLPRAALVTDLLGVRPHTPGRRDRAGAARLGSSTEPLRGR